MADQPKIEIKNLKYFAAGSEETHCFEASVYVDGEKFAVASNDGHGGPDRFAFVQGKGWDDLKALNALIAASFPKLSGFGSEMEQDLEMVICGLVNDELVRRDFDRAMKRSAMFVKPDAAGIFEFKVKKGFSLEQVLAAVKPKYPAYRFLADMPRDEAFAIYRAA